MDPSDRRRGISTRLQGSLTIGKFHSNQVLRIWLPSKLTCIDSNLSCLQYANLGARPLSQAGETGTGRGGCYLNSSRAWRHGCSVQVENNSTQNVLMSFCGVNGFENIANTLKWIHVDFIFLSRLRVLL